ncbi:MAG: Gfo/Idh/MocA family protein [Acidimicrobiales bacterium]
MRIGILGAARIAPKAVVAPARELAGVDAAAVAARSFERAKAFAAEHDIASAARDYQALCDAPELDAVYVALPAALHGRWVRAALAGGKHVLCEKPLAANADEAAELVAQASDAGLALVEAQHWRCHPLAERLGALLAAGEIGRVTRVDAGFTTPVHAPNIRYELALGGGALMDLGCYPVHWARFAAGEEPEVIDASAVVGPPEVDLEMSAGLAFPSGAVGRIHCSMDPSRGPRRTWLEVHGTAGAIRLDNPLTPQLGHTLRVEGEAGAWSETVPGRSTFDHQLDAFARTVAGEPPRVSGADSLGNARTLDAIYRAAGLAPRRPAA